ncbi:unnamed protein product [Danaus chrysippus]|uniref:(African queen) hypothetical protein n=1 Tax=Danaus chrysippus TaxID=151541 RepID=A0A8J2QUY7_9NEOP|nr:unnamed protein product [Danaus chrysippus]
MNSARSSFTNFINDKYKKAVEAFQSFKHSDEDLVQTRKLTIESTKADIAGAPSQDIDKQIDELEELIHRLQNEIVEMSDNADRDADKKYFLEPIANTSNRGKSEDGSSGNSSPVNYNTKKPGKSNSKNYFFPVFINDAGVASESKPLPLSSTEALNETFFPQTPSTEALQDTFFNIRKRFSLLWNESEDVLQDKELKLSEGHKEVTFSELRAVISDQINRIDNDPLKNMEEKYK